MQTGIGPDADGAKLLREATHIRIVLGQALCVGELLAWDHTEFVCLLYDNALGQRTIEGFPDHNTFLDWLESRLAGGHDIRFI